MLTQFRTRYPKGSLTSELLAIEHGKYIVKVLVQVEGITLATGLAASFSIEEAEDSARIRALATLNLDATPIELFVESPSVHSSEKTDKQAKDLHSGEQPSGTSSRPQTIHPPILESIQDPELPQAVDQLLSVNPIKSLFNGNKKVEINSVPITESVSNNSDVLTSNPEQPVTSSKLLDNNQMSSSMSKISSAPKIETSEALSVIQETPTAEGGHLQAPIQGETLFLVEATPEITIPESSEPLEENPLLQSQLPNRQLTVKRDLSEGEETSLDNPSPVTAHPFPPEDITPLTPPIQSTYPTSEPLDFSDIMARSNAQLKRLGWTTEKGRDYLLKTYGKKSRHLLNDEELLQFLNYLESLPSTQMDE